MRPSKSDWESGLKKEMEGDRKNLVIDDCQKDQLTLEQSFRLFYVEQV